jgi:CRP-like cAMP-binding protein
MTSSDHRSHCEEQLVTRLRSNVDQRVEMLHGLDVFEQCTRDELERIAQISTELRIDAGRVLCRQGEFDAEFFVIVDGEAGVHVDGRQATTLGRGSFFGEHALLDHSPRNATVTAITPMSVLVLNRAEFETMLHDAPHAASEMLREISHRVNPPPSS